MFVHSSTCQAKERMVKVLMVLTSHDQLGNTGRKTGFWLEELAAPYYVFKDAGAQITLASPKGGRPPLDPKSDEPNFQTDITRRFEKDVDAEARLNRTLRLDTVKQEDYDTVFYPGGHGPMWDLAEDQNSIKLIESLGGRCTQPQEHPHPKATIRFHEFDTTSDVFARRPYRLVVCKGATTIQPKKLFSDTGLDGIW
jgi:hypothetical protein